MTSREGVSARLLLAARAGRFQLVASPLLLDELADVLTRPKFRRYLSIEDARRFVDAVRALAVLVDDPVGSENENSFSSCGVVLVDQPTQNLASADACDRLWHRRPRDRRALWRT